MPRLRFLRSSTDLMVAGLFASLGGARGLGRRTAAFAGLSATMLLGFGAGGFGTTRAEAADNVAPVSSASPADLLEQRRARFAYDRSASFAIEERSIEMRGATAVRDILFVAKRGEKEARVAAYVVVPAKAPRAAVLWVHWLGEPATTNRSEFLPEAVELADRGVVSVLIDAMWARPHWYPTRVLEEDYGNSVDQVIALLRALDLLRQQPGADRVPVGIVGHDYGGMYATMAAAIDGRVKVTVWIACTPSLLDWAFFVRQPASREDYLRENRTLELRDYLGAIDGAAQLFQFAEHDKFVPLAKAQEFFAAATASKQMVVYGGADHSMVAPASIRSDRAAWLSRELGLDPAPPAASERK
jgi:pimeloyl-ACP methyl ester carboxylesterase